MVIGELSNGCSFVGGLLCPGSRANADADADSNANTNTNTNTYAYAYTNTRRIKIWRGAYHVPARYGHRF